MVLMHARRNSTCQRPEGESGQPPVEVVHTFRGLAGGFPSVGEMPTKQPSSRQQRSRANKAHREALAARTKAASTPRDERVTAPSRSAPVGAKADAKADAKAAADGKPVSKRPARLGSTAVDPAELNGGWLKRMVQLPGGLQALSAASIVLLISAMSVVLKAVPPEGAPNDAKPTRTLFEAYGPKAFVFILPPVLMAALALAYGQHVRRRRAWMVAAFSLVTFGVFMGSLPYLLAGGFLGYAAFRSRQVEGGTMFGEAYPGSLMASDDASR